MSALGANRTRRDSGNDVNDPKQALSCDNVREARLIVGPLREKRSLPRTCRRFFWYGNAAEIMFAYVEVGEGDPIVLQHGNPTSSYLWRNILPYLQPLGRCIAPDLIGMGDSAKLANSGPGSYRFVEHRRYLDALLEALDVRERVTFVIHDWGSALGFDWANRHRGAVKGIAFMEAIVAPQGRDHWDKMGMREALEALRSEAGEAMVLQNNYFIEEILPNAIQRKLSDEEMTEYRRPFAEPGE